MRTLTRLSVYVFDCFDVSSSLELQSILIRIRCNYIARFADLEFFLSVGFLILYGKNFESSRSLKRQ